MHVTGLAPADSQIQGAFGEQQQQKALAGSLALLLKDSQIALPGTSLSPAAMSFEKSNV